MKYIEQEQHNGLSKKLLWLLSTGAGFVVANLYYSQPLLGILAKEFNASQADVSIIPMITQLGYAAGLLLIVPLGDMFERRKLVLIDIVAMICSLSLLVLSTDIYMMFIASFFLGITSVIPQVFIPITVHLSEPKHTTKNVSTLVSVLLIGILLSRVFSGLVAEYLSWRAVYYIAICIQIVLFFLLYKMLPKIEPTFHGTYKQLMHSILHYGKSLRDLRISAIRGGLSFAVFSIFWTTLVFRLERPPFFAGSDIAGLLGLVGVVGAIGANLAGRFMHKTKPETVISAGILLMLLSWIIFGFADNFYWGLIVGIILLDLGSQIINVSNQSIIFSSNKHATSRINTVYMSTYFVGGSLGTYLGGIAWQSYEWSGVVVAGIIVITVCLLFHICMTSKKNKLNSNTITA